MLTVTQCLQSPAGFSLQITLPSGNVVVDKPIQIPKAFDNDALSSPLVFLPDAKGTPLRRYETHKEAN